MLYNHVTTKSKEAIFWEWFQQNEQVYLNLEQNSDDILDELEYKLSTVNKHLSFAIGPYITGQKRQLVITADGIRTHFPAVSKLTAVAPPLPNWAIVAFRQPHTNFTCIRFGDIHLKLEEVYYRYAEDNGKIALQLHLPNYSECEEWQAMSFILLDSLLGEYDTEMWLTSIETLKLQEKKKGMIPIKELPQLVYRYKHANSN